MIVTPFSHAYHRNDVLIQFLVHESLCVRWSWYHIHSTHSEIPSSFFNCDPYCCNPPWSWLATGAFYFLDSGKTQWLMLLRRPADVFSASVMWRKVQGLYCPWSVVDPTTCLLARPVRASRLSPDPGWPSQWLGLYSWWQALVSY